MYHAPLGSQTPEHLRPMNRYFGVEDDTVGDGPQVERKRNDLFECPSDRGDACPAGFESPEEACAVQVAGGVAGDDEDGPGLRCSRIATRVRALSLLQTFA